MVFTRAALFVRAKGPDEFWKKRRIFKLSAHFRGRPRNVYTLALRAVHRALVYATKGRKLKKLDMAELWTTRVSASAEQYGVSFNAFKNGLIKSDILLNKKMLADLAIWEPRSFEALAQLTRERAVVECMPGIQERSVMNQVYGLKNLLKK